MDDPTIDLTAGTHVDFPFQELTPPAIPYPRRNWQPREEDGKYWATPKATDAPRSFRKPPVDLTQATLDQGRARNNAKRTKRRTAPCN